MKFYLLLSLFPLYIHAQASIYSESLQPITDYRLKADRTNLPKEWIQYADQALEAVRSGDLEKVKFLAKNGLDLHSIREESSKGTLLHIASQHNQLDIADFLLAEGAKVHVEDYWGDTPLDQALESKHYDMARFLIAKGALSEMFKGKYFPLQKVAAKGDKPSVELLLATQLFDIDIRDSNQETALMKAARFGRLDVVKFLVDSGADIKARNTYGAISLHLAARSGHFEVVEFLLEKDPSMVDIETKYKEIPLHNAGQSAKPDVMNLLIQYGSNIYARDSQGRTPSQRVPRKHRFIIMVDGFFVDIREQNKKIGCYPS